MLKSNFLEVEWNESLDVPWSLRHCVITPFLPTGFSRVSACKTRQPNQAGLIRRGLITSNNLKTGSGTHFPKSNQVWPELTKFDRGLTGTVSDPTGVHYTRKPSKRGLGYISRSSESFDQSWPSLTGVDQVWPNRWPDRRLNQTDRSWPLCRA